MKNLSSMEDLGRVWENYGKKRIYFDMEKLLTFAGVDIIGYKYKGEALTRRVVEEVLFEKVYYDCIEKKFSGTIKLKKQYGHYFEISLDELFEQEVVEEEVVEEEVVEELKEVKSLKEAYKVVKEWHREDEESLWESIEEVQDVLDALDFTEEVDLSSYAESCYGVGDSNKFWLTISPSKGVVLEEGYTRQLEESKGIEEVYRILQRWFSESPRSFFDSFLETQEVLEALDFTTVEADPWGITSGEKSVVVNFLDDQKVSIKYECKIS